MEYYSDLLNYASDENISGLKSILSERNDLNLNEIQDDRQFTLLHLACFQDNFEMIHIIIEYILSQQKRKVKFVIQDQDYLKNYIYKLNDDGFNAIHLMSYRGNLYALKYFVKICGQSIINTKNPTGLTPMHTAAQGDNAIVMTYLKENGLQIDALDDQGRSPLHWATYQQAEISAMFLIAWGVSLDRPDNLIKMTPLHLAALGGSVRIAKKLLLKGVDKNVKDDSGKTPLDIAKENDFKTLTEMFSEVNICQRFFSVKQQLKPPKQYATQYKFFITFQIVCAVFTSIFCLPFIQQNSLIYCFFIFTWLIVIFMVFVKQNPGKIIKNISSTKKLSQRLEEVKNIEEFCPECEIIKPFRSRHCDICKSCVKCFDHHCPWINTCIGASNHLYFYCMIVSIQVGMILQIVMHIINIKNHELNLDAIIFSQDLYGQGSFLNIMHVVASIIVITICGLFQFPLGLLVIVQTSNLYNGKTTSEKFSQKFKNNTKDSRSLSNETFQTDGNSISTQETSQLNANENNFSNNNQKINQNHDSIVSIDEENSLEEGLLMKPMGKNNNQSGTVDEFYFTKQPGIYNCIDMCFRNKNNPQWGTLQY